MSIWLMCTYFSFVLFEKLIDKQKLNFNLIFLMSLTTAYLLSIRIAGLLIFVQYFITFLILISFFKINIFFFIKNYFKNLFSFLVILILFIFIFYPIFWLNPSLIIDTFKVNVSHFNNVGTNTFGELMYANNLPVTYLPIWFMVKVPLFILFGLFTVPFVEKIFLIKKNLFILERSF